MVSAAKLRRAQERVVAARPYGDMLRRVLANVAAAAAGNEEIASHPLLEERDGEAHPVDPVHVSDRGWPARSTRNLSKPRSDSSTSTPDARSSSKLIGRKGRDFLPPARRT